MQTKKIDQKILKQILIFALIETLIAAALVAVDLCTKYFAFRDLADGGDLSLLGGFLTLTAVKNTGASFGIFGSSTVALTIVSFLCSVAIYAFSIFSERTRTPLLRISLILVLAGAIGNLVDRMVLGYVRDLIQLSIFPWVFNIADSYLTVGVVLLIVYVLFFYSRDKERSDKRKALESAGNAPTAEGLTVADSGDEDAADDAPGNAVETANKAKLNPNDANIRPENGIEQRGEGISTDPTSDESDRAD